MDENTNGMFPMPSGKLLKAIQSAIGKWYEPLHIKKIGGAVSEVAETMPVKYERDGLIIDGTDYDEIAKRTQARISFQEEKRQSNIENVITQAMYSIEAETDVSEDPVDEDWITRFFRIAEDISTEEMQFIWGRILAGEVKKPGSFSIRTLETIKNLQKSDAEVFQKIAPLVFRNGKRNFLASDKELLKKYDIYFSHLLTLQDAGLLNSTQASIHHSVIDSMYNSDWIIIIQDTAVPKQEIISNAYVLTTSGTELLSILEVSPNKEYAFDYAKKIYQNNQKKNITVTVNHVNKIQDETVNFRITPEVKYSTENPQ